MQYDSRRNKIEKNKKSLSRLNIPRVVLVVSLSCVCLLGAYIYEATITIPLNENFTETATLPHRMYKLDIPKQSPKISYQ